MPSTVGMLLWYLILGTSMSTGGWSQLRLLPLFLSSPRAHHDRKAVPTGGLVLQSAHTTRLPLFSLEILQASLTGQPTAPRSIFALEGRWMT